MLLFRPYSVVLPCLTCTILTRAQSEGLVPARAGERHVPPEGRELAVGQGAREGAAAARPARGRRRHADLHQPGAESGQWTIGRVGSSTHFTAIMSFL